MPSPLGTLGRGGQAAQWREQVHETRTALNLTKILVIKRQLEQWGENQNQGCKNNLSELLPSAFLKGKRNAIKTNSISWWQQWNNLAFEPTLLTSRDSVFLKISLPLGNEKKRKEEMTNISAPLIQSFFWAGFLRSSAWYSLWNYVPDPLKWEKRLKGILECQQDKTGTAPSWASSKLSFLLKHPKSSFCPPLWATAGQPHLRPADPPAGPAGQKLIFIPD